MILWLERNNRKCTTSKLLTTQVASWLTNKRRSPKRSKPQSWRVQFKFSIQILTGWGSGILGLLMTTPQRTSSKQLKSWTKRSSNRKSQFTLLISTWATTSRNFSPCRKLLLSSIQSRPRVWSKISRREKDSQEATLILDLTMYSKASRPNKPWRGNSNSTGAAANLQLIWKKCRVYINAQS